MTDIIFFPLTNSHSWHTLYVTFSDALLQHFLHIYPGCMNCVVCTLFPVKPWDFLGNIGGFSANTLANIGVAFKIGGQTQEDDPNMYTSLHSFPKSVTLICHDWVKSKGRYPVSHREKTHSSESRIFSSLWMFETEYLFPLAARVSYFLCAAFGGATAEK